MKRFIKTKFFRMLQESSQKSIDLNIGVLKNGYDKFAIFVFSASSVFTDMAAYRNVLVYTRNAWTTQRNRTEKSE